MTDKATADHFAQFDNDRSKLQEQMLKGQVPTGPDLYAEFRDDQEQDPQQRGIPPHIPINPDGPQINSVPDEEYYNRYSELELDPEDRELFPGGPMLSQVQAWKKQYEKNGHMIVVTEIGEDVFVFRTLNRYEYKQVVAIPDSNPIEREEIFCNTCVLWPPMSYQSMTEGKGGIPSTLAQIIMEHSGFTQQWEARIL